MYEVELKVELTAQEKERLILLFKEKGFKFKGVTPQRDFYIEAVKSPLGGFNLKRYRDEANKLFYTEKVWEEIDGKSIRKESERAATAEEFSSQISDFPDSLKIEKDREWFAGNHEGRAISITIDSVKFDHSKGVRYFIEAEIGVTDKNEVMETKEFVRGFLKVLLGKVEIIESPGMFTMAFEKK